jgi:sigma-B regulation protein RsbU (phosphoserine phosphatase)
MLHLKSSGMPVGIAADSRFLSKTFQLEVGDVLVTYTDGIIEAENRHSELWGQRRLETLLRSCSDRTPEQIIQGILDQVSVFENGHPQHDDMTLVVMRVQTVC